MERSDLLKHRILFLGEPVSKPTVNRLVEGLLLLDADDHERQIDLYINCTGGDVLDALALIDVMHCIRAPVSTICIGQAAGIAAWILSAGAPGRRLATPNSEVKLQQFPTSSTGQTPAPGFLPAKETAGSYSHRLQDLESRLLRMLAEWTKQPEARIKEDMKNDFFLTAREAKGYGIIDAVLQPFGTPIPSRGSEA
jgi:ATP-dependent Clp protease, protease subunit